MGALVAATAEFLRDDPAIKNIDVRVEGSVPTILADAELLKIVFVNLLVNGAQAMQGRGTIRVSLASIGDSCQIAIGDSGPGIPVEIRERSSRHSSPPKPAGRGWAS